MIGLEKYLNDALKYVLETEPGDEPLVEENLSLFNCKRAPVLD